MTKTCTITTSATTVCGAPAVSTTLMRSGREIMECVEHHSWGHGEHITTCVLPLPSCHICSGEFGLVG